MCDAQKEGELENVTLRLGNKQKTVNLKVPLAFIIGDIQGGDGICGRSAYYGAKAKRICRMCDATPDAYESIYVDNCNLLVMEDMMQLSLNKHKEEERQKLRNMLQTPNWLAFYNVDYGGSPGGVFTAACPPEALHSLENGLILHCLKELFQAMLSPKVNGRIDAVVKRWANMPKQHPMKGYAQDFPRLIFFDGLSSISNISASHKVGKLFAYVLAALTKDGREVLLNDIKKPDKEYIDTIQAFEMLLCYWAWLKKDEYWDSDDEEALATAKQSICVLCRQLKSLFPRSIGSNWEVPKFHEQLHVAYNIQLFGAHKNIHTGPQEHNHIANAKKPSKQTQKRKEAFDIQIGSRLVDRYVIEATNQRIEHQKELLEKYGKEKEATEETLNESNNLAAKFQVIMKRIVETNELMCSLHG